MKNKAKVFCASLCSAALLATIISFISQDKPNEVAANLPDPPRMFSTENEVAANLPDPPRMFSTENEVAANLPDPPRMFTTGKTA